MNKLQITTLLATFATAGFSGASAAVIININASSTAGSSTFNGVTWNQVNTSTTTVSDLLDSAGAASGITYEYSSSGNNFHNATRGQPDPGSAGSNVDFSWATGANSGVIMSSNGAYMPWEVISSYMANNTADAIYTITLTSSTQYYYSFTLANSRTSITDGETFFNVGGSYNTTTKSFDGGTSLSLTAGKVQETDPSVKFDMGVVTSGASGFLSSEVSPGLYGITLQIGKDGTPGGGNAAYLNGLIVSASPIPEPSTYAIFAGLIALGLVIYRRRRS